ncbi:MAG: acetolactate synthase large subunit [Silicimonas sp.]|nr:acetolactate synthase large subunit [Silicimonas sp.]NND17684.1 acetolactate synthase large subunit [Silicimonas sp.]NND20660.1 acetolactate synthase large subunit [Silicimonas sp.]NND42951.1 acetolactate synthase large subunit [Silicimonas sp.]
MKAADLFVKCLENEAVEYIFGVPGEENIDVMDALIDSKIQFVTTRHEQGAAFIADVYGRLTGRAGVCLSTLGPGATNLVTGVADGNMDCAPMVAIAGQGSTARMHKESHQILDLVNLFDPITKYSTQIRIAEIIPEIIRKAFKTAQAEKPGCSFIDLPENVAEAEIADLAPLKVQRAVTPTAPAGKCASVAEIINQAKKPVIMAGNGVIRERASAALVDFAEKLNVPVATTFMAKGAIPFSHALSLGTIGLKAHDYVSFGFDEADLIICVGVDMVEYHPALWNPNRDKKIVHIDESPAEVDAHYILEAGVIGTITDSLERIGAKARHHADTSIHKLHDVVVKEIGEHAADAAFPVKPQKIIWDLRQALDNEDIVISDVGAHKMWIARMYQAEAPNTCIISNGFASMGIALPGAIAAKLAYPDCKAVAVCGDAGFMMNNQEIETAMRLGLDIVILIFNDSKYGLIEWHQQRHFGRATQIDFTNPDFVKFAESFGAKGYRVEKTEDLLPTLQTALGDGTVSIIDCPVNYAENMKLTKKLQNLKSPI